jgi:hypothetical protein
LKQLDLNSQGKEQGADLSELSFVTRTTPTSFCEMRVQDPAMLAKNDGSACFDLRERMIQQRQFDEKED